MNQKYILVTGASRGIGRSIALKFAREGYHVFLNCRTSLNELEEVQNKILSMPGGSCTITTGDVGDPDQVRRMFQEIHKICPGLDVLVNNAGISHIGLLIDMTDNRMGSSAGFQSVVCILLLPRSTERYGLCQIRTDPEYLFHVGNCRCFL